jgi:hypothetical protein
MTSTGANVSRTANGRTHLNTIVPSTIRIRLFDPFQEPMPSASYRLTLGERTVEGKADDDAWLEIRVAEAPEECFIEWGRAQDEPAETTAGQAGGSMPADEADQASPSGTVAEAEPALAEPNPKPEKEVETPGKDSPFRYQQSVWLDFQVEDEEEAARRRLCNFGYSMRESLAENIKSFQRAYHRPPTGSLADITDDLCNWHDDCQPEPCPSLQPKSRVG